MVSVMAQTDEDKHILQYSKRLALLWAAGETDGRLAIGLGQSTLKLTSLPPGKMQAPDSVRLRTAAQPGADL